MIRTALDSEDLSVFTHDVDFILTYTDLITDPRGFEAAHPAQQVRYIDRGLGDPGLKATIADVERFAMTPAQLPQWYDVRAAAGHSYLTVYCSRNTLPAVSQAMVPRPYSHWIATLDGTMHIDGFTLFEWPAVVQILGAADVGFNADFSVVFSNGWNPSLPGQREAGVKQAVDAAMSALAHARAELTQAASALTPLA